MQQRSATHRDQLSTTQRSVKKIHEFSQRNAMKTVYAM